MKKPLDILVCCWDRANKDFVSNVIRDLAARLGDELGREVSFRIIDPYRLRGIQRDDLLADFHQRLTALLTFQTPSGAANAYAREAALGELFGSNVHAIGVYTNLSKTSHEDVKGLERLPRDIETDVSRTSGKYWFFLDDLVHTLRFVLRPAHVARGYVFISYAEEDSSFVDDLRRFLGENGYSLWEYRTGRREYSERIDIELEKHISQSVATVCVLSESWRQSPWTMRELIFSQDIRKSVFLIKAKTFSPTLAISGLTFIDCTSDSRGGFAELMKELDALANQAEALATLQEGRGRNRPEDG